MERYSIVLAVNTEPVVVVKWDRWNPIWRCLALHSGGSVPHSYCLTSDSWMYVVVLRLIKGETTPHFPSHITSYDWASLYYSLSLLKKFWVFFFLPTSNKLTVVTKQKAKHFEYNRCARREIKILKSEETVEFLH